MGSLTETLKTGYERVRWILESLHLLEWLVPSVIAAALALLASAWSRFLLLPALPAAGVGILAFIAIATALRFLFTAREKKETSPHTEERPSYTIERYANDEAKVKGEIVFTRRDWVVSSDLPKFRTTPNIEFVRDRISFNKPQVTHSSLTSQNTGIRGRTLSSEFGNRMRQRELRVYHSTAAA